VLARAVCQEKKQHDLPYDMYTVGELLLEVAREVKEVKENALVAATQRTMDMTSSEEQQPSVWRERRDEKTISLKGLRGRTGLRTFRFNR